MKLYASNCLRRSEFHGLGIVNLEHGEENRNSARNFTAEFLPLSRASTRSPKFYDHLYKVRGGSLEEHVKTMTEIGPVSPVSERGKAENRSSSSARLPTTGVSVVTRIVSSTIILVREFTHCPLLLEKQRCFVRYFKTFAINLEQYGGDHASLKIWLINRNYNFLLPRRETLIA